MAITNQQDYIHFAQVGLSLKSVLSEDDFNRYIDRMIWAIHAATGKSAKFDEAAFRKRCHGETV